MSLKDLKESEFAELLQSILKTAVDGIIIINNRGIILEINDAALNLFEYEEKEVVGRTVNHLMPKKISDEHDTYLSNYQRTRQPKIIGIGREVEGRKKSGDLFPFRLGVSEVILNDRVIYCGIIHDITEIKKTQTQLNQINEQLEQRVVDRTYEVENVVNRLLKTNNQLETEINERLEIETKLKEKEAVLSKALSKEKELNDLKSNFVSMASHEFRTPLATILSSAALISRYQDLEGQDSRIRHISKIKSAVIHLTGILNDFLSISKLEEGAVGIEYSAVSLNQLCKDVVSDLKGILKKDQVINVEEDEEVIIFSDPKLIVKSLFNLISNAIKYSPIDGVIGVAVKIVNEKVKISVQDNGLGIPLPDQKFLFQRFFRASNTENIQGTGLGLNIVKRYVTLLHGHLDFISTENEGSTFTITLPLNNEDEKNTSNRR